MTVERCFLKSRTAVYKFKSVFLYNEDARFPWLRKGGYLKLVKKLLNSGVYFLDIRTIENTLQYNSYLKVTEQVLNSGLHFLKVRTKKVPHFKNNVNLREAGWALNLRNHFLEIRTIRIPHFKGGVPYLSDTKFSSIPLNLSDLFL